MFVKAEKKGKTGALTDRSAKQQNSIKEETSPSPGRKGGSSDRISLNNNPSLFLRVSKWKQSPGTPRKGYCHRFKKRRDEVIVRTRGLEEITQSFSSEAGTREL